MPIRLTRVSEISAKHSVFLLTLVDVTLTRWRLYTLEITVNSNLKDFFKRFFPVGPRNWKELMTVWPNLAKSENMVIPMSVWPLSPLLPAYGRMAESRGAAYTFKTNASIPLKASVTTQATHRCSFIMEIQNQT